MRYQARTGHGYSCQATAHVPLLTLAARPREKKKKQLIILMFKSTVIASAQLSAA